MRPSRHGLVRERPVGIAWLGSTDQAAVGEHMF
jgi:hypothetical protein